MNSSTIHNFPARAMLLGGVILLAMVAGKGQAMTTVERAPYGETPKGDKVEQFTLTNDKGMTVKIIGFGATVTELRVPDRAGQSADVVLGVKDLAGYLKGTRFMGAIVGRYGNRVANAEFTLDGASYKLDANNDKNTLHGGKDGFYNVVWSAEPVKEEGRAGVRLTYVSKDGEEGFPGELTARVTYWLPDNANELRIEYEATTTKPTVVNLTHHSYFNLAGQGADAIVHHTLLLNAPFYLPVDSTGIPTGEMRPVAGTPFDFTQAHAIGARIGESDEQLKFGAGYDHCFVLAKRRIGDLTLAAKVSEPASGRAMEVWTTEPGIQLYSGNHIDETMIGKSGKPYKERSAFCLETQHFPDSPNKAQFPSTVLRPGEEYRSQTVYKFMVE